MTEIMSNTLAQYSNYIPVRLWEMLLAAQYFKRDKDKKVEFKSKFTIYYEWYCYFVDYKTQ